MNLVKYCLYGLLLISSLLPGVDARAQDAKIIPIVSSLLLNDEAAFAPIVPITSVSTNIIDRRGGLVQFSWTAVSDGGPDSKNLSAYHLRCASQAIATEGDWLAARVMTITTVPGAPGVSEIEQINGFQVGEPQYCIVRGANGAGLTPLYANTALFELKYLSHTIALSGSSGLGKQLRAVGDINGDGKLDVLSGGDADNAYLWFGSTPPLSMEPHVVFSTGTETFGQQIEGIGDFNDDGKPDFAIAAPGANSSSGRVYVFFGRASGSAWPSNCDIDLIACPPDVIVNGTAVDSLGWSLSSTDFDGDSELDLILGAPTANLAGGRVYVMLGGSHITAGSVWEMDPSTIGTVPNGFIIPPPAGASLFGLSVASIGGSVVGDSREDIVISAPGSGGSSLILINGTAYSGTGLVPLSSSAFSVFDSAVNEHFTSVAAAGDFNADGILDVQAYSPLTTDEGNVRVYFGSASGFSSLDSVLIRNDFTSNSDDLFGFDMGIGRHAYFGNLGFINTDSVTDLLLGSDQSGTDANGAGFLFYGSGSQPIEHLASEATTIVQGANGVRHVAFIGDINGDGHNDFAIGEPAAGSGAGRIVIFY